MAALVLGVGTSYFGWKGLPENATRLFRETAGPKPINDGQRAAVVALPLLVGAGTLAGNLGGCAYMAIFWARGLTGKTGTKKP